MGTKPFRIYLSACVASKEAQLRDLVETEMKEIYNIRQYEIVSMDMNDLIKCDAAVFCLGWQLLTQSNVEFSMALKRNLRIFFEQPFEGDIVLYELKLK
jgi:hypothetical protein